jgi:hypothetical protein
MSSQCGQDVEGKKDKEAILNLCLYNEVEGQDKKKKERSTMT